MSRKIHKYTMSLKRGPHNVVLRHNIKILDFQTRGDQLVLWVEEDPEENIYSSLQFIVAFTGDPVPLGYSYLKTLQVETPMYLVYHIYLSNTFSSPIKLERLD